MRLSSKWPFIQLQTESPSLQNPTPPPIPTVNLMQDPLVPQVSTPMSAYWGSGRVSQQRSEETLQSIAEILAFAKERSIQVLKLREGNSVLDVGCGTGQDLPRLQEKVGQTGEVWGVDNSPDMVSKASTLLPLAHVLVGNVYQLPFHDNFFDAVRAERLLMHLDDPIQALKEMERVTKPGGIISIVDSDTENLKVYPCDPILFQRYMSFTSRRILKHPRVTYRVWDTLRGDGLHPILETLGGQPMTAEMMKLDMQRNFATSAYAFIKPATILVAQQANVITEEEAEYLSSTIQQALDDGSFLLIGGSMMMVSAVV
jgi:ubiquinone/menaquinone biosynthesis C-methylase UbiE